MQSKSKQTNVFRLQCRAFDFSNIGKEGIKKRVTPWSFLKLFFVSISLYKKTSADSHKYKFSYNVGIFVNTYT